MYWASTASEVGPGALGLFLAAHHDHSYQAPPCFRYTVAVAGYSRLDRCSKSAMTNRNKQMCGRFTLTCDEEEIIKRFEVQETFRDTRLVPRFNIAPSTQVNPPRTDSAELILEAAQAV